MRKLASNDKKHKFEYLLSFDVYNDINSKFNSGRKITGDLVVKCVQNNTKCMTNDGALNWIYQDLSFCQTVRY